MGQLGLSPGTRFNMQDYCSDEELERRAAWMVEQGFTINANASYFRKGRKKVNAEAIRMADAVTWDAITQALFEEGLI